jgi:hypothetical protein
MNPDSNEHSLPVESLPQAQEAPSGGRASSFCLPTHTVDALITAKASVLEIAGCLSLAAFTDSTGQFSTASTNATYQRMPSGWTTAKKALEQLCKREALGRPLVSTAAAYTAATGQVPVDGPVPHAKVRYVLETFGEAMEDRVWFGKGLVQGFGEFANPLGKLADAGPLAMRLLLLLYRQHEIQEWIGVPPATTLHTSFSPMEDREPVGHGFHLIRYKRGNCVPNWSIVDSLVNEGGTERDRWNAFHGALQALIAMGLVYESTFVVNRAPLALKDTDGVVRAYRVPEDAQPLYLLSTQNGFGYKQRGEEGIGGLTARLAGELRLPVATKGGIFDGAYAALEPPGSRFGITGVYRLRFRPSNAKNAGVRDTWARLLGREREAVAEIELLRRRLGMRPAMPVRTAA